MQAKDLRVEPPRRWNERIDGIPWLPRLIDKARAAQAGTLGTYLFGQSPTDGSCLRALGLRHRDLASIVSQSETDDAVIAAIAARDPAAIARGREWGERYCRQYAWFFFCLDLDEGYAPPALRPFCPLVKALADTIGWTVQRIWPTRVARPSA